MEYKEAFQRINNFNDIEGISKTICKEYGFEEYTGYKIIEIGYEDFNYVLSTSSKNYFIKILNTDRTNSSCDRLVKILSIAIKNGINVPKLYKTDNSYLYKYKRGDFELKLIVMEYIEGHTFYELERDLTDKEIKEVAITAANLNRINFEIDEFFYDEWTLTNLAEEFEKKKKSLASNDYSKVSTIVKRFKERHFKDYPYAYIHGDIQKANLILGKEIYLIDFSDFNYLPRIIEIIILIVGLCISQNRSETIEKINILLNQYNKLNPLEKIEIQSIPLLIKCLGAMFIIQTSYIRENDGSYIENEYWYKLGISAINLNLSQNEITINHELNFEDDVDRG